MNVLTTPFPGRTDSPLLGARLTALLAIALLALGGCNYAPKVNPYRMELLQGNYVTQDMVSKLQPGMTRDQVKFILGTPLLVDTFRDNRWDYIFLRQAENSRATERRHLSVFFEDDKLKRVDGDVVPTPPTAAAPGAATGGAGPKPAASLQGSAQ